jgi:hypothetical protein
MKVRTRVVKHVRGKGKRNSRDTGERNSRDAGARGTVEMQGRGTVEEQARGTMEIQTREKHMHHGRSMYSNTRFRISIRSERIWIYSRMPTECGSRSLFKSCSNIDIFPSLCSTGETTCLFLKQTTKENTKNQIRISNADRDTGVKFYADP